MEDSVGNETLKEQVNAHIGSTYRTRPPKKGSAHISERILNWSTASSISLHNRQEQKEQGDHPAESKWQKTSSEMSDSEKGAGKFFLCI